MIVKAAIVKDAIVRDVIAKEGLSAASVVERNSAILESEMDGEVMALNIDSGACYGFNRIGSRIWKMIAGPRSVAGICARLVSEYEVDDETCERQVLELLEELRAGGLVEVKAVS